MQEKNYQMQSNTDLLSIGETNGYDDDAEYESMGEPNNGNNRPSPK